MLLPRFISGLVALLCVAVACSAPLTIALAVGPHWHEYSCGWESRAAAEKAAALRCDTDARPYLIECTAVRYIDPDGNEHPL